MTATERLRAMLDECGVEWEAIPDQQEGDFTITATQWHDGEGGLLTMFIREPHGGTWDFFWLPTPEQAIAATLGAGTCHNVHEPPKDTTFWPSSHFKCSECGSTHVSMEYVFYCPNCGRKVVDE